MSGTKNNAKVTPSRGNKPEDWRRSACCQVVGLNFVRFLVDTSYVLRLFHMKSYHQRISSLLVFFFVGTIG